MFGLPHSMMGSPVQSRLSPEIGVLDRDGLAAIEAEWTDLWHRCLASPFQHPGWLLPWARHYAADRSFAVTLRLGGRLEALAPVFLWKGVLRLAGTGPSDQGDWLLTKRAEAWAGVLFAELAGVAADFRRIDLRQLPPGSSLRSALVPAGWTEAQGEGAPCHSARLAGADGLGAVSTKCRSNWRYAMRRIEREGGQVELVPAGDTPQAMEALARCHALRWRERGESGMLADPLIARFLPDAAAILARAGVLRLYRLRFGEVTAAALMVLAGHATHAYYIGGFDPAHGRLSPSSALIGFAMRQAAREGAREFDFLRGAEPYKARWGARAQPRWRRVLVREDA
ncbi:MAG TPA: GNAT family N-acetyltransferase [Paracoccaceae bacterium]|nr:GNAT family N-acetyltransferase [Paracoccaceae bacterium]